MAQSVKKLETFCHSDFAWNYYFSKIAIFTVTNFDFGEFIAWKIAKIYQKQNTKMAIIKLLKSLKIYFT